MSQLGMQLPGSQRGRKAQPNVYTGLLLFAVIALVFAVVLTFMNLRSVAPGEGPLDVLKFQDPDRITLSDN